MRRREHMPRLTISDWEELGRAGARCDEIAATIATSSSAWRDLVLANLGEVKNAIARVWNKGEAALERVKVSRGTETALESSEESGPEDTSDQVAKVPPVEE